MAELAPRRLDHGWVAAAGALLLLLTHVATYGDPLSRKQRRDDEVVLAHVVGDLELEVHEAEIVRGEHLCAVVPVARGATRCAGVPTGDSVTGEAPLGGVLGEVAARWPRGRRMEAAPSAGRGRRRGSS